MLARLFIAVLFLFEALPAYAQTEIRYLVWSSDFTGFQDMNRQGDILVNYPRQPGLPQGASAVLFTTGFGWVSCPGATSLGDTVSEQIDNRRSVSGTCHTMGLDWGFIYTPPGLPSQYQLLMPPGGVIAYALGRNDGGFVVGQYYEPLDFNQSGFERIHGFLYYNGQYMTVDFPGEHTVTALLGISNSGRITGAYFDFDPVTNAAGPWTWFSLMQGQFTPISSPGSVNTYVIDMNNNDQILLQGDNWNYFLYDDGHYFKVALPETTELSDGIKVEWHVNGLNDNGLLVGDYLWTIPCQRPTPSSPFCPGFRKGFVAFPLQ